MADPVIQSGGIDVNTAKAYWRQQAIAAGDSNPGDIDDATALQYWQNTHPSSGSATAPETAALQQMAQIDPVSESLRNQLGQSYTQRLASTSTPTLNAGQAPSASAFQSYLDLYKQTDPQGFAQRQAMGQQVSDYVTRTLGQAPTSAQDALSKYQQLDPQGYAQIQQLGGAMGSYLGEAQQQAALGSQLDPQTIRELEQSTRQAQAARGNIYGTPQMVAEAMTRGQAGMAIQQQREAALGQAAQTMQGYLTSGATLGGMGQNLYQQGLANQQNALGLQQSYLQSGTSIGDLANQMYNTGFGQNLQAYNTQLGALNQAQGSALGYLGSGQTPYQVGAAYVNQAQNTAGSAAQGGPQYNPASLSSGMTGTAQQAPQYGLDIGAQAQQWYQSMSYYSGMQNQPQRNQGASAASGAASGALSGATAGTMLYPGIGTAIGAVAGGILGGVGGYFG